MTKTILRFILPTLLLLLLAACGVDRTDPKSVAEEAMRCYAKGDYKGLAKLVDPIDERFINTLKMKAAIAAETGNDNKDNEYTLIEMHDGWTPEIKIAEFRYTTDQGDQWTLRIEVEEHNGKWYYAGIR